MFMKALVDKHETVSCKRRIAETSGVGYTFCLLHSSTDVLTEGIFFKGFIAAIAESTYTLHSCVVWSKKWVYIVEWNVLNDSLRFVAFFDSVFKQNKTVPSVASPPFYYE